MADSEEDMSKQMTEAEEELFQKMSDYMLKYTQFPGWLTIAIGESAFMGPDLLDIGENAVRLRSRHPPLLETIQMVIDLYDKEEISPAVERVLKHLVEQAVDRYHEPIQNYERSKENAAKGREQSQKVDKGEWIERCWREHPDTRDATADVIRAQIKAIRLEENPDGSEEEANKIMPSAALISNYKNKKA
jgi:hypothetical protein